MDVSWKGVTSQRAEQVTVLGELIRKVRTTILFKNLYTKIITILSEFSDGQKAGAVPTAKIDKIKNSKIES